MHEARVTATTDERRWLRALRPMILLGGFGLVWWFLMTGTAQATGGPDRELADTARAVTGNVERVIDRQVRPQAPATRAGQHQTRVAEVTRTIQRHVAPVATPVVSVAEQAVESNVEPVATGTTDTVRSVVGKVARGVRSGLENSPAGSVLPPELKPDQVVGTASTVGESSPQQGETRSNGSRDERFAVASPVLSGAGVVADLGTSATAVDAGPNATASSGQDTASSTLPGGANSGRAISPVGHDGASAAQSGNGHGLASDRGVATLVIAPSTTMTSTLSSADRLPAGPAYPPASSPD